MRVALFGSRDITDMAMLEEAIAESGFAITEVGWGTARGVDALGKRWADARGIPVVPFPPDVAKYGVNWAMKRRNNQMAEWCQAGVGVWDGRSTGTAHMESACKLRGRPAYIKKVKRA